MQQWLPHIYTELCKCRVSLAQKEAEVKQRDDLLEKKNKELEEI